MNRKITLTPPPLRDENQRVINNRTKLSKFLTFAIALMAFLTIPLGMWGQTQDSYTATSSDKPQAVNGTTTGTVTGTNSISWSYSVTQQTASGKSPYVAYSDDSGWQLGSNNSPCTAFSFSTSGISGTITKIETVTGSRSASSKISVTVGGEAFGTQNQTTGSGSTVTTQTFTGSASGTIVVSASASTGALYFKSVTVTYTTGGGSNAHTLSSSVSPAGAGSVALSETSLEPDETATATATANAHFTFTSWSISGEGASLSSTTTNPTTVTMGTENATVTATFTEDPKYNITYKANYEGSTDEDVLVSGYAGESMTIAPYSTFSRSGYAITSWNTAAGGDGTSYSAGDSYPMTSAGLTLFAQWEVSNNVVDVLDADFTGNPSSYSDWSETGTSGAVYAGQSSGGTNYIQLRATSPSGIVSTTSGGKVKKVVVTWNSSTQAGRTLDIYGSNTAYTAPSNLYSVSTQGTKLGSIEYGTSTELNISDDYAFIGMRSNSGAMYLDEIKITWESVAAPTVATPTFSVDGIGSGNVFVEMAEVTITAPDFNTHYIYYTTDGTDPDDGSDEYDGTPINISSVGSTTIKAIAYDGDLNESAIGSVEVTIVETTNISDVYAAADDNSTYYYIEGIITYISGSNNMYVEDNTGGILVYGGHTGCAVGNHVVIKGTKTTYNSLPEFQNITILNNDGQTNTLPETAINISQIGGYMFRRVKFTQVLVGSTSENLTAISQSTNSVGVYNIPAIENVTEEGYYLKTITGVVASYSGNTQLYVASAGDITIYDVDASSNNTSLGTVTTNGYMVTATPASGAAYDDPAYEVETGATSFSVTQTGNNFKVITNGDLIIEIQFAAASATCAVTYHVNGTIGSFSSYETKYQNSTIGELPTSEGVGGLTFAGWSTSESAINIIDGTYEIGAVTTLDLYAVYSRTISGTPATSYNKVSTISEGQYLIVYEDGNVAFDGGRTNGDSDKIDATENTIDVTITSGSIASTAETDGAVFNIALASTGEKDVNYTIQSASGFYIGKTAYANGMDVNETTQYTNSITIDASGNAVITASGDCTLRYNSNSDQLRFRYYKSGQKDIQLYKKETTIPTSTSYYTRVFVNETSSTDLTISGPSIIPNGSMLNMNGHMLTNTNAANLTIEDGGRIYLKDGDHPYATVQKNINGYGNNNTGNYYLITQPLYSAGLAPASVSNMITDNVTSGTEGLTYDLYQWDFTKDLEWQNYRANTSMVMAPNQAYLYANENDVTLGFAGQLRDNQLNSLFSFALSFDTENNYEFNGWNLKGNPTPGNAKISQAFYKLNSTSQGINTTPYPANSVVGPMEGFFVKANTTGQSVDITPTTDAITAQSKGSISLNVNHGEEMLDRAIISLDGGLLDKLCLSENTTKIYFNQGNAEYAIVPSVSEGEMPVCFKASKDGVYTVTVETGDLEVSYLHLIDNFTGNDVDLLQAPSYTFNGKRGDIANRFRLVFNANGIDDNHENGEFAFVSDGQIVILNGGEATLRMIDVLGRVVSTTTVNGSARIDAQTGVYVLQLVNGTDVKTQKIVVK